MRWLLILAASTALAAPALAQQPGFGPPARQTAPQPTADDRINKMIEELRGVIGDAERRRTQDPQLLNELKQVVNRYDWPWRVSVLREDYRDRDMTKNPTWTVASGRFAVDAQLGMRSQQPVRAPAGPQPPSQQQQTQQPAVGLGLSVLGAVVDEVARRQQQQQQQGQTTQPPAATTAPAATDRAEAYVAQGFSNAFAITVALNSRSRDGGRIELAAYQGSDRRAGYRLAYNPGPSGGFELIRASATGSGVIQTAAAPADLDDGANHRVQWTRDRDGTMAVQVDGRAVMEALDRGVAGGFDGFAVVNLGGDFGVRSVAIDGADRR